MKAVVNLVSSSKGTSTSLRFIIPPPTIDALGLEPGNPVQVQISGIYQEENQTKPLDVDIPMPGTIIKAGGTSLAITVRSNIVKRFKLQEGQELVVDIIKP